ncbi:MAG: PKD domain-containing protein [Flammeovirgaceae bacterium]|nr:PKD domain-containing protein [Flammeovirgaceae bacterium]
MRRKLTITNLLTKPFIVLALAVSQISALNPIQLIKSQIKNQEPIACEADLIFQTNRNECLEHKNEYYCVELSVSEQVDPEGNKITHTWDLGDGNLRYGPKLDHCYDEYGKYPILLISQRKVNGISIVDTTDYNVNIDEIVIIQEIKEDQFQYFFDGSNTFINQDFKIDNYYWSFGDGHYDCQVLTSNRYTQPGEYNVRLIVEGIAENGLKKRICGKKKITIR